MKNIKFALLFVFASAFAVSCHDDPNDLDLFTAEASEGGLVEAGTALINYVVGEGLTYTGSLKIYQGAVKTNSVEIYKQFSGAAGTSNKVLMKTVPVSATATSSITFDFKYEDLIQGLSINGSPLPTDDSQLSIGDAFTLSYNGITSEGNNHQNVGTTKVAVSTRFGGIYVASNTRYVHPVGEQPGFDGLTVIVESVDATTYHILTNGPFGTGQDPDNEFYFVIEDDDTITIPQEYPVGTPQTVWSGDPLATCEFTPTELPDVCGNTNYVVRDDVNGKDQIIMSHGYIRSNGTRQFIYTLTKI